MPGTHQPRERIDSAVLAGAGSTGEAYEEALARCEFLWRQRRPWGLVQGEPGGTHSSVLREMAAQCHERPETGTGAVDGCGLDAAGLTAALAELLGCAGCDARPARALQLIRDRLAGLAEMGQTFVLCIDHAGEASPDIAQPLTSLLRFSQSHPSLTVLAAADFPQPDWLLRVSREFGLMRISGGGWSADEVTRHLQDHWNSGGDAPVTPPRAVVDEFQRLTRGLPRDVQRLCEILSLAQAVDDSLELSADSVRSAAAEVDWGVR